MTEVKIIFGIKSRYIIKKVFALLGKRSRLLIINKNNKLKDILNVSINDYRDNYRILSSIEIELKPSHLYGEFINLDRKNEEEKDREKNYHIYFNDNKDEIKNKYYLNENDKVTKIKILIDYKENHWLIYFQDVLLLNQ